MNPRAAVAAFCLLAATAGSAANIWVEHPISERRMGTVASTHSHTASAASDGKNFLVVWEDDRGGMPANRETGYEPFATRVDGNGKTLDVPNIQLPMSGNLLWTGSGYLLYNYDQYTYNGITQTTSFYVRLDMNGRPLDLTPLTLPVAAETMAFNGKYYIAVDDLNVSVLSANLSLIRTFPVFNNPQYGLAVAASNGDTFVIAGEDVASSGGRGTRIVVLDGDGNLLANSVRTGTNDYFTTLRIATDGASYAIVGQWNNTQFRGSMLDRNGAPGNDLPAFGSTNYYSQVAFAWMGNEYQLLSQDSQGMPVITPISRDGVVLNSTPIWKAGMPVPVHFTLASNGASSLLLWSHNVRNNQYLEQFSGEIYHDPADLTAGLATGFPLGEGALNQELFSAATRADGTALVTWRERLDANDPLALYAARVAPDGTILDPQSIRIAGITCDATRPAVATDGRDFLVAWLAYDGVHARRISGTNGSLLDAAPVDVNVRTNCQTSSIGIASNGSEYLLAWYTSWNTYVTVNAVRIGSGGGVLDSPLLEFGTSQAIQFNQLPDMALPPHVTTNGQDFLVAFTKPGAGFYGGNFRLITAGGELSEEDTTLALFLDAEGAFFSGKSFVVLGYTESTLPFQPVQPPLLLPVRVGADGSRLDPEYPVPAPLPLASSYTGIDAACDESGCISAGAEQLNHMLSLYLNTLTDPSGAIERTDPELIASVPEQAYDWNPMAMVLPGSPRRVIYERAAIEPELGGTMRIFIRTMLLRPRTARH